jgi:hypothetical protein
MDYPDLTDYLARLCSLSQLLSGDTNCEMLVLFYSAILFLCCYERKIVTALIIY